MWSVTCTVGYRKLCGSGRGGVNYSQFDNSRYCVPQLLTLNLWFHSSPPISDYDVFNEGKTQSFFQSQNAVMTLCTYLEEIRKLKDLSQNQLHAHFTKLLQVSGLKTTLTFLFKEFKAFDIVDHYKQRRQY